MSIYARQIANAKRLIKAKGQLVIWAQTDVMPGTKPWSNGSKTTITNNVSIVFLPQTKTFMEFLRYMKGSDIPVGSMIGLMGSVTFDPKISDIIIRPNDELKIKSISPLAPNGDIIFYQIEIEN
jgi:hypothetical protein